MTRWCLYASEGLTRAPGTRFVRVNEPARPRKQTLSRNHVAHVQVSGGISGGQSRPEISRDGRDICHLWAEVGGVNQTHLATFQSKRAPHKCKVSPRIWQQCDDHGFQETLKNHCSLTLWRREDARDRTLGR